MKTLKLFFLHFKLYSLRITERGIDECMECVSDPGTINRMVIAGINNRAEQRQLVMQINELTTRNPWRLA